MRLFCSICKDIFIPSSEVHATNCGHLYHASCLGIWLQRHRTCPQCRTILTSPVRVFFDVDNEGGIDPNTLEHELENAKDKLLETETRNKELLEKNKDFEKVVAKLKESEKCLNTKNGLLKSSISALKDQVKKSLKKAEEMKSLESEVEKWKAKAAGLEKLNTLLKSTAQEVSIMLESTPVTPLSVKHLCTYVAVLRDQLQKLETKNVRLTKENHEFNKKMDEEKMRYSMESRETIKQLKTRNLFLENEISSLKLILKERRNGVSKSNQEENMGMIQPAHTNSALQKTRHRRKSSLFEFDLSDDEKDDESRCGKTGHPVGQENIISNWEELVCAGPSRMNFQSRSLRKGVNDTERRDEEAFAYDGLGGRKKIRLGGPTPLEEFQKIKKSKKEKRLEPSCQHRKIIDFYQRN